RQDASVRAWLSFRLARRTVAHQASLTGADLRHTRAGVRTVLAAFGGAQSLLYPGAPYRLSKRLVGRGVFRGTATPSAGGCLCGADHRAVHREKHCTAAFFRRRDSALLHSVPGRRRSTHHATTRSTRTPHRRLG